MGPRYAVRLSDLQPHHILTVRCGYGTVKLMLAADKRPVAVSQVT